MMEDIIERRHFAVAVIVLEGYFDLKKDMLRMMAEAGIDNNFQKRVLVLLSLLGQPQRAKWDFDAFFPELSNLTCYLLHKLVIHKDKYIECCLELEKRMKDEWKSGIMAKSQFFYLRRCYFELKRIVERLDEKEYYNITYDNENHMKIIYQHIV